MTVVPMSHVSVGVPMSRHSVGVLMGDSLGMPLSHDCGAHESCLCRSAHETYERLCRSAHESYERLCRSAPESATGGVERA